MKRLWTNLINAQANARRVSMLFTSQDSILKKNKELIAKNRELQEEVYDYAYGENELIKKIAKLEGKPYKTASETQKEFDNAILNI